MSNAGSNLLFFTALAVVAQTPAPSQRVTEVVVAARTGVSISPYLYGQLIEHAGKLISPACGAKCSMFGILCILCILPCFFTDVAIEAGA